MKDLLLRRDAVIAWQLKRLGERFPAWSLPVVAEKWDGDLNDINGFHVKPEHVYQALQAGARGYLLKESAGREVVEAIFAVSEGKIYLSQPITATLIADYLQQRDHAVEENLLDRLSQREREILPLVLDGKSSAGIGELLHLSPKTLESYRSRMMHKLGVDDLPGLMKFAMHGGLIT